MSRIMNISRSNTLIAALLAGIGPDKQPAILDKLDALRPSKRQILCIWRHHCGSSTPSFIDFITMLAELPCLCPATEPCPGIWDVRGVPADETHIFGPPKLASEQDCAFAECDDAAIASCSRCYLVRYCSPLCQRLDYGRHRAECKKTVASVETLSKYGRDYARRAIKNLLKVSDVQFDKLWAKVVIANPQCSTADGNTRDPRP